MGVTDRSPQDASIFKSFKVINEVTDHKHKINKEKSQRLLWPSPFVPKWAWQYGSSRYIYKIFKFHSKCNYNQLSVLYFAMKGPSDLAKIQVTSTFDLYMGVVHRTHLEKLYVKFQCNCFASTNVLKLMIINEKRKHNQKKLTNIMVTLSGSQQLHVLPPLFLHKVEFKSLTDQ